MTETSTTTKLQTTTDTLQAAFAFVWSCIERPEIGPEPTTTVEPFWTADANAPNLLDDDAFTTTFAVSVTGTVTVKDPAPGPAPTWKGPEDPSPPLTAVPDAHGDTTVIHFNGAFGIPHEVDDLTNLRTTVRAADVTCIDCLRTGKEKPL